jgi:shikimate dehydrogenase
VQAEEAAEEALIGMAAGIVLCGSLSRHAVPLGAAMHTAAHRALGLSWCYVPFETEDLEGALTGMRALGIRGFGISMPFKERIIPLLDAVDPLAARIGAVNTVVNDDGRLTGHNTDWFGAARALAEALPLAGRRVLVAGAGGAGRAVARGLTEGGAALTLTNRSEARGRALASEIGARYLSWADRQALAAFDAIVNATSMGMATVDAASPWDEDALRPGLVVMDIVYAPLATRLVLAARRRGAVAIDGGRMLLWQAARQVELYTGREAPLAAMDEALCAAIAGA